MKNKYTDNCVYCKEKIIKNPRFVLMEATMLGYQKYNFCELKCLLDYIFKKHRKKFEKKYLTP